MRVKITLETGRMRKHYKEHGSRCGGGVTSMIIIMTRQSACLANAARW